LKIAGFEGEVNPTSLKLREINKKARLGISFGGQSHKEGRFLLNPERFFTPSNPQHTTTTTLTSLPSPPQGFGAGI
jgi:hypothetical protein